MDPIVASPKRKRRAPRSAEQKPAAVVVDHTVIDPERLEKIARLKQSVEDGTYRVSSEEVARKVIEHMLDPKS